MGALFATVPRTVLNSEDSSRVHKDFRGRVSLTGDTSKGDCSVTVSEVKQRDASSYVLEMRRRGDMSWSKAAFELNVSSKLRPVD